ncbi:hypothetical protein [Streptomyces orinoci]|uniref:Uncharacterized protein n=1 Tax=Streptomyces orinoci TaxID=67339 RepID=A0ABV3K635_STRON|nr:hypothetical protein [Streptomyces orinoci]
MRKRVAWEGLLPGVAGVTATALAEKAEERCTGHPDSRVPGRMPRRLAGWDGPTAAANPARRCGQGAVPGVLHSAMARAELRGPFLDDATGAGALPAAWLRGGLVVDLLHKADYAPAIGAVADALAARGGPGPGQRHASRDAIRTPVRRRARPSPPSRAGTPHGRPPVKEVPLRTGR